VNPSIALPLKAYPNLAMMDAAMKNTTFLSLEQKHFLLQNGKAIEGLVAQVITGMQSPNAVAPQIQNVFDSMPTTESHP
jgi:hypothetical protein